jgi:hypothetical protein
LGDFRIPGLDPAALRRLPDIQMNTVSPGYFAAMGMRIARGRGFGVADVAGAPGAVIVSASLAKLLWPRKDALGQCMQFGDAASPCSTVVGIADDIKNVRLTEDPGPMFYRPAAQAAIRRGVGLVVRMRADAAHQVPAVREALQREMPGASYVNVTPYSVDIGDEMKSWRLGATMFVAFGALALVLAAIGLYSVVSYNVAQRAHEMGVRRALGAQTGDVVGLVVRQGVLLGGVGVVLGLAGTYAASGQVGPLLFGVSPHEPMVYAVVAAAMLLVAAAASFIPARRASRVDPNVALRLD